ncbi:MAG TPA: EAL domain-containing protein [Thermoanaerobaculaceae bacterium]|nr:EAL domain-containing protein [Thermoanaerobaculaceae bacterium]
MDGTTRPLSVLLIEDSPEEAELIEMMLAQSRREVVHVDHVARLCDGLARLAAAPVDVILLDFTLPDSRGLVSFQKARTAAPHVPIVILTNLDDEETALSAVREGAQDYLVKRQVDNELLLRSIRYAIERMNSERALWESEERYALAVNGANDGIWDFNLITGTAYFSPRWKSMLGYRDDEIGSGIEEWFSRVHPDDRIGLRKAFDAHLGGHQPHFEHEHRMIDKNGSSIWVLSRGLAVRDGSGKPTRVAGSLTDITARKRAEEQLLHDALYDALTQLPNRTLFLDHLGLAMEQSRRRKDAMVALLFIDLDRFKNINDSLGHSVGDELLVELARRLTRFLRPGDTVARLGGDEFAILLNDIHGPGDATRVAERVQDLMREKLVIGGREVFTSASIGVALSNPSYRAPEEILRDADTAMYRAKAAGRGCYQVFDQTMHRSVVALLKLETELRQAVEKNQFLMHYQPIVSLEDKRIVGFEGLVRWLHPERGLISPSRFIGVAEETGLIVPLGWWVLEQACRHARDWQRVVPAEPPLYVSVNVSGKVVMQPDMYDRVVAILEQTGLSPSSLRLEITENVIMDHGDLALQKLAQFHRLGVQFSVDDFGTGYSSLSYLQRFSYDTLKIDRSFISGMETTGDASAIVKTIVALANMLKINVVAEGVETAVQFEKLREIGCSHAQGFWFSRPVDRSAAEAMLLQAPAW